ncbi:MAG: hypothetical protein JWM82_2351, partial [Myxococcales bacterium]|nr:hypothetical protein [Myxococcales bacterium]
MATRLRPALPVVACALALVVGAGSARAASRPRAETPRTAVVRALRSGHYEVVLALVAKAKRAPAADRLDLLAVRARVALGR